MKRIALAFMLLLVPSSAMPLTIEAKQVNLGVRQFHYVEGACPRLKSGADTTMTVALAKAIAQGFADKAPWAGSHFKEGEAVKWQPGAFRVLVTLECSKAYRVFGEPGFDLTISAWDPNGRSIETQKTRHAWPEQVASETYRYFQAMTVVH